MYFFPSLMRGDTGDGYNRSWYRCHTAADSLTFALLSDLWAA